MNQDNNALARTEAASLRKKMAKFEFVFAKMFMRLIMRKTKILTVQIQNPELNILDGLVLNCYILGKNSKHGIKVK